MTPPKADPTFLAKRRRIDSSIDLTPLIDVVFQLLIFLMVTSQFIKPDTVVDLPLAPGDAPKVDDQEKKISLVFDADGQILLDEQPIERADLGEAIRELVDQTGVRRAEVRGDKSAQYEVFVEIMETARTNGVESLGVVKKTEKPDAP